MSDDDLKLRKPAGFDKRFNEYLSDTDSQQEAYERVEADHQRVFGEHHYSDFKSYYISRLKRLKKERT